MQQYIWSFSTVGGVKRVNLDSGSDLRHLAELDQKLWTALSCPVNDLEIDATTLQLIDTNNDGQIRVPEILEAVNWMISVLKNPDDLLKQEHDFPLSAINTNTDEGKTLLASAIVLLKNLGKEDSTTLTVAETSNNEAIFAASRFNGDGIITEDSADTLLLSQLLNEVITCIGSLPDRSGKAGISAELLQTFLEQCVQYSNWYDKADNNSAILPFGELTEEAFLCFSAIEAKVNDYFIRCKLAAFDEQSTAALNLSVARVESISAKDLSTSIHEIAEYPLAKVEAYKPLPLNNGINPAWENLMAAFKLLIADTVFPNQHSLTETDWKKVSPLFSNYLKWKSEKSGIAVEPIGINRIKEILINPEKELLQQLIEKDKALENEAYSIILVDKMVRYYRDLFTLLKNFVTFYDFYSPGYKAIFQAGTLYIDQRSCDLCIKVNNMSKHSTMVSFSGMFLLYCECTSRTSAEKMVIVAALTNGDIDNLMVGRNALFYDRNGLDWDATIIKIVDNPISIRQAFFAPYRKVSRFIESQVNKFAAAQDDKATTNATKSIEETPVLAELPVKPAAPPFDVGKFVGIFAAIALALGAIGTAIASVISGFMGLVWWKMPLAILGIMLLISCPSMILAYLKLRKRNLAPILDANGWAINANMIVNIQFGNKLTQLAQLPPGSKLNLNDPFSKKKRPSILIFIFLSVGFGMLFFVLWKMGYLHL